MKTGGSRKRQSVIAQPARRRLCDDRNAPWRHRFHARGTSGNPGHESINFIVSDGRGYYVFLPAIVIDGTLDFSNQIRRHWGDDFDPALLARGTERGYVKSRYMIGMALTLSPAFLAAHAVARGTARCTNDPRFTPDGYSTIYQVSVFVLILAVGWATMLLIDRLLIVHFGFGPSVAMTAVAVFWVGSHYAWYYFREPMMVHVVSTFWVTLAIGLCVELMEDAKAVEVWKNRGIISGPNAGSCSRSRVLRGEGTGCEITAIPILRRWLAPTLVLAMSMAILCRPTNVFITPILLLTFLKLTRDGLIFEALRSPWPLGLAPLALQAFITHRMTGHFISNGYGPTEGFNWTHPALFPTLFSTRHGLLVWTPLLILSLVGIFRRLVRPGEGQALLRAMCCSALGLWYLNSAWRQWWFGWSFGNRAFLELAIFFAIGLACVFDEISSARPVIRRAVVYAVAAMVLYTYVLMSLYAARYMPSDGYWF